MSDKLAVDIGEAADIVGLSKGQFRRVFLDGPTPRIRSIRTGKRDRVIDLAELRAAYEAYKSEARETH